MAQEKKEEEGKIIRGEWRREGGGGEEIFFFGMTLPSRGLKLTLQCVTELLIDSA